MRDQDFESFVAARCEAKLAEAGVRWTAEGTREIDLSPEFSGWVGFPVEKLKGAPRRTAFRVNPMVGVRDREVGKIVAELQGLPQSDPAARPHYVVIEWLRSLIPGRSSLPPEWVASAEEDEVDRVARQVAEDVVSAGFPHMRALASPDAYYEAFKSAPRKITRPRESAVTYMLHGELDEARRMLERLARPVSQNPLVWADKDAAAVSFFDAFSSRFDVDLGFDDWPIRGQAQRRPVVGIRIHREVVTQALALVNRSDLAERGSALTDAQMKQIGVRASEILAASGDKDPDRATGLAMVEFLSLRD